MLERISLEEVVRFAQTAQTPIEGSIALAVKDGETTVGCFIFCPSSPHVWTVHTLMTTGYPVGPAGREASAYMAQNFDAKKINAFIPAHNRACQHAAIQAGMTREGYSPKALWEDDEMNDVVYYGVIV